MNRHLLVGNLAADPVMRRFPSGDLVASFRMGTSEWWRDNTTGELKSNTDWHNVVAKGPIAEQIGEWARKGSHVMVEGRSKTRKWTDDKGATHYMVEVHVDFWKPCIYPQTPSGGRGREQGSSDDDGGYPPDDGGGYPSKQGGQPDYRSGPFSANRQ